MSAFRLVMFALPPPADSNGYGAEGPLLTQSGHSTLRESTSPVANLERSYVPATARPSGVDNLTR